MLVQKIAIFGVLIAVVIATLVLTLLITNFTRNAKSLPLSAPSATTAVAETLANSTNSTNSTTGAHNPENLTFSPSPSTHPQSLAPQKKSILEQAQNDRLKGPPLPSSGEPIHGPAPGTTSP
jgi:predicted PurR-regulated permease PerM